MHPLFPPFEISIRDEMLAVIGVVDLYDSGKSDVLAASCSHEKHFVIAVFGSPRIIYQCEFSVLASWIAFPDPYLDERSEPGLIFGKVKLRNKEDLS